MSNRSKMIAVAIIPILTVSLIVDVYLYSMPSVGTHSATIFSNTETMTGTSTATFSAPISSQFNTTFPFTTSTVQSSTTTATFDPTLAQTEFFVAGKTYSYNLIPSSFTVGNFSVQFLNKLFNMSGSETPFAFFSM